MPTIVDMRPSTNTFRHATLIVTASMEYYKKYVEGNQDFDNSEQIKEELDKLEASDSMFDKYR